MRTTYATDDVGGNDGRFHTDETTVLHYRPGRDDNASSVLVVQGDNAGSGYMFVAGGNAVCARVCLLVRNKSPLVSRSLLSRRPANDHI